MDGQIWKQVVEEGQRQTLKEKKKSTQHCLPCLFHPQSNKEKETDGQMEEAETDLPGAESKNNL